MMIYFANGGGRCYVICAGKDPSQIKQRILSMALMQLTKREDMHLLFSRKLYRRVWNYMMQGGPYQIRPFKKPVLYS